MIQSIWLKKYQASSYQAFCITLSSYVKSVAWLVHDSIRREKMLASAVLVAGLVGVLLRAVVFGLVVVYARYFSSGEVFELAGLSFDPRTSLELLIGASISAVVLLFLATLSLYYARVTCVRMSRGYEEHCGKRVIKLLGQAGYVFALRNTLVEDRVVLRLIKSDSRVAGRLLRRLLSIVVPVATLAGTMIVLFYLEAALTALVVLVGVVFIFYQYRVSRKGAEHSARFEKLAYVAGNEYQLLIRHYKYLHGTDTRGLLVEDLFASGPVKKQLDSYEGRLRAVENSQLVSGIFAALIVGLIFLIMGWGIIGDGAGWERLLVYVVALRFAMVGLQGVFSAITSINRFYPKLRRYKAFVEGFATRDGIVNPPLTSAYMLKILERDGARLFAGSKSQLEFTRGQRLAVATPLGINRYTLPWLCGAMSGADEGNSSLLHFACYVNIHPSYPERSLRQVLGLGPKATWDELRTWFPDEESWVQAKEQLPTYLDTVIAQKHWGLLQPNLKFMIGLISARLNNSLWIFLQAEGLCLLGPNRARFYLDLFENVFVVLVYNGNFDKVGEFGEEVTAVFGKEGLLGLGSVEWFQAARKSVTEWMEYSERTRHKTRTDTVEDEDFDE